MPFWFHTYCHPFIVPMSTDAQKNPIWERLELGRRSKAAQGGYAGYGSPPFGEKTVDGNLVADEKEQQIIELIRRHHKSGKSLQQIANWMNTQGYKTKRGKEWQRISVKRVLDRLYGKTPRVTGDPGKPADAFDNEAEA
ncbi:Recombinase [Leptolyngbya sp. PCC 7375]|nr:Recombinase [Leptolyngbya sp. PCC 7375]